jgi:hypothetical protein
MSKDESVALYSGYDYSSAQSKTDAVIATLDGNPSTPGNFWNSSCDDFDFKIDADGHCISFGVCYGDRPAVMVWIEPPKVPVATAQALVRKIAGRLNERIVRDPASIPKRGFGDIWDPRIDDDLSEKVAGYGDEQSSVQVIITGGVSDEVARTLLHKIAGRITKKRGRYALKPLPKLAKVGA